MDRAQGRPKPGHVPSGDRPVYSSVEGQVVHPDWLQPDWELPESWPRIKAFMTTRAGGVSTGAHASMNVGRAVQDDPTAVNANRAKVDEVLGARAVFLHQVHGADVLHLEAAHLEGERPKFDASISTTSGIGCAIQVADCLPVLFAAPGAVGGAHAGWRGLAGGVLENTVRDLCDAAACDPAELRAWMGPCIGPEQFEVGADVVNAFGGSTELPDPAFFVYRANAKGEPRWLANLPALARARLQQAGLTQITGGHWCTLSEPSRFFSFRHEPLAGRMVAAIRLL